MYLDLLCLNMSEIILLYFTFLFTLKKTADQLLLPLFDTVHPPPLSLFPSLADRRQWCAIGILLAILFVVVMLLFIL